MNRIQTELVTQTRPEIEEKEKTPNATTDKLTRLA